jgi:hypothetical protein
VQLLLGHTKLESTVRYLGIEVDDAHEIAETTEILCRKFSVSVPIEGRFPATTRHSSNHHACIVLQFFYVCKVGEAVIDSSRC